jgi:hypothetical protein
MEEPRASSLEERKHTAGPWTWTEPDYSKEHEPPDSCASYGLEGASGSVLSGCGNCGNIFYSEEDGRLIAAAPDLLAALQNMTKSLASYERFPDGSGNTAAFDKARAAILKATSSSAAKRSGSTP